MSEYVQKELNKENKKDIVPQQSNINKTGIPLQMKKVFEQSSGFSFDDVRVHYNSDKPMKIQALAYTQGNHVFMGRGQEKHLSHELGHVVQQKAGMVKATSMLEGLPVNEDAELEKQADGIVKPLFQMEREPVIQRLRLHLGGEDTKELRKISIKPRPLKLSMESKKEDMELPPSTININDTEADKYLINNIKFGNIEKSHFGINPYKKYGPPGDEKAEKTLLKNEDIIFEGHGDDKSIGSFSSEQLAQIVSNIVSSCGYDEKNKWDGRVILLGCCTGFLVNDVAEKLNHMLKFNVTVVGPKNLILSSKESKNVISLWNEDDEEKPENYIELNATMETLENILHTFENIINPLNPIVEDNMTFIKECLNLTKIEDLELDKIKALKSKKSLMKKKTEECMNIYEEIKNSKINLVNFIEVKKPLTINKESKEQLKTEQKESKEEISFYKKIDIEKETDITHTIKITDIDIYEILDCIEELLSCVNDLNYINGAFIINYKVKATAEIKTLLDDINILLDTCEDQMQELEEDYIKVAGYLIDFNQMKGLISSDFK